MPCSKKEISVSSTIILRRNPEIVYNDIDGEIVMMSVRNGRYYGANSVGRSFGICSNTT